MGVYKLSDGYELKGWRNIPYALVNTEKQQVKKITPSECLFLLSCDGVTELEETSEVRTFLKDGVVEQLNVPMEAPLEVPTNPPDYEHFDNLYRSTVQLAITGRCNLHCRHCLAADGDENVSTQLTLADCNRIFDEMVANDIFKLWITGGEPLVHPQFREIFQSATDHGLRVTCLFTNAWLVDSDLLDLIDAEGQKPQFVVSFDGIGTHDWMRNQEGAEEHTLEKIALLRERNFPVRIGLNVNSVTAPGAIESCRTLVNDYGVTSLRPIYTSPTPRWHIALAEGLRPMSEGDYYDLMIELLRTSRVENWNASIDVIHMPKLHNRAKNPKLWDALRTPPKARSERTIMSPCPRACDVMFITSDGRVLPCSTYEGASNMLELFQGDDINVLRRPFKEILTDSAYTREFEITIVELEQSEPKCAGCKWEAICCGGCPLYTLGRKHVEVGNPICTLYKGGYAEKYLSMLEETDNAN